jgi:hypothetical protein
MRRVNRRLRILTGTSGSSSFVIPCRPHTVGEGTGTPGTSLAVVLFQHGPGYTFLTILHIIVALRNKSEYPASVAMCTPGVDFEMP